jgi:hypothetical protein
LYAYHLFSQGLFDRALEYFIELGTDPLEVIGLYPNLLPRDVRAKYTLPVEISELGRKYSFSSYLIQNSWYCA